MGALNLCFTVGVMPVPKHMQRADIPKDSDCAFFFPLRVLKKKRAIGLVRMRERDRIQTKVSEIENMIISMYGILLEMSRDF